jgi:HEAT repeat protein
MAKETLESLIAELIHEEDWRRMRATAACVKGGPKAVEALLHSLETANPDLKVQVAGMLARLRDPRGGIALVGLLRDAEPAVRAAGAAALEQLAGVLDEAAAAALVEQLAGATDESHKQMITDLLGVIPTSVKPLGEMLKHPAAGHRATAAEILEHLLDPRSADALVDAMADPSLQESAVRTLRKLGAVRDRIDRAFDALRNVEDAVEREELRMATVIDLLGIGRPAVEILIEYLRDDDWVVREAAADLLGKIGDVRAVEPLMERLRVDKDTGVKEHALKSLGLIGDPRPAELYIEAIPIRPLRVFAMEALAKIKEVGVLGAHFDLFDRLKSDRDGLVAYNAGLIVDKLAALRSEDRAEVQETHHDE